MASTVEVLSHCVDTAIDLTTKVKFDADDFRHLYPVSLYSSILELTSECLYLVREGPKPGIPILSRAILETFVNLKNVTLDVSYVEVIEFEWLSSWVQLMNEAEEGNVYLGSIAESEDLAEKRDQNQQRLADLKDKGVRKLRVIDKFEKAGLAAEYRTIYGFMSAHSHGSLQSLLDKHIDVSSGRPEVSAFIDRSVESLETYLGTTCEIFMQATEAFHQYFESEYADTVAELRKVVDAHKESMVSA